jgi:tetratricopeptide (TPR) repeat protein
MLTMPDTQACACGSGLRPPRCCALATDALPPASAMRHLVPLVERARQAFRHGQTATAEQLCLELLELAPSQRGALEILYRLRRQQNKLRAAETLLRRLVRLYPNEAGLTCELALLLLRKGDLAEAEMHARNAVRIAPIDTASHNLMGMVLTEGNRPQPGEYHYRRVLELSRKRDPIVLANLAWNLKTQGRIAEARELYRESAAAAPEVLQTLLGWARAEEADRNFAAAAELLTRAEAVKPGDAGVRLARAVLHGRTRHYDDALALLDAMPEQNADSRALDANELLEKGRLLDKLGRYDEAFAAYQAGKKLARDSTGKGYLAEPAQDLVRRLTSFFIAKRIGFTPRATVADATPQPIFILGFPRAGTTLVEQTLSAHPNIRAGDELPMVNDITQIMPRVLNSPLGYPEALAELWMGDQRHGLDTLRDYYFQRARQLGAIDPAEPAPWFTDKMPLNETHLGLIALLFPQAAPLIHVHRHPLDVAVSMFSNHLTHGFRCAFDLDSVARHYVLVMDLVEHYRAEMALRYLPVRYEDVVGDQEASVRRLLAFIGEKFDPRCLRFQENRRHARTASYAQVTEPLYRASCFRYKNYRRHLAPILPILQPTIARLGYTVEWETAAALAA